MASYLVFWDKWDRKRCYFKKQSGEVIDNTGSATKNKPEQTEKQSGEVVENTFLWKKQTENKPENKAIDLVENIRWPEKTDSKRAGTNVGSHVAQPPSIPPAMSA